MPSSDNSIRFGVSDYRNNCPVCPALIIKLCLECQIVATIVACTQLRLSQHLSHVPSFDNTIMYGVSDYRNNCRLCPALNNKNKLGDGRVEVLPGVSCKKNVQLQLDPDLAGFTVCNSIFR